MSDSYYRRKRTDFVQYNNLGAPKKRWRVPLAYLNWQHFVFLMVAFMGMMGMGNVTWAYMKSVESCAECRSNEFCRIDYKVDGKLRCFSTPSIDDIGIDHYIDERNPNPTTEGPPNLAILASFTAEAVDGKVILDWTTATEIENAGFLIWRGQSLTGQCSDNADDYTDIQQVGSWIDSESQDDMSGASYSYEDAGMVPGTTYYYALEDIDNNGKSTFHMGHIISITVEQNDQDE